MLLNILVLDGEIEKVYTFLQFEPQELEEIRVKFLDSGIRSCTVGI